MHAKSKRYLSVLKKTLQYFRLWSTGESLVFKYILCKLLVYVNVKLCEIRYWRLRHALLQCETTDSNDVIRFVNNDDDDGNKVRTDRVFVYAKRVWRLLTIEFADLTRRDKIAVLSYRLRFNLLGDMRIGEQLTDQWFLYRPLFEPRIETARTVHISIIKNRLSTALLANYATEALRNYFQTPILVTRNDCLRIDIDEFATFVNTCQWHSNEFLAKEIFVRVTSVLDANRAQTNRSCWCVRTITELVQDCDSQSFVYFETRPVPECFRGLHTDIVRGLQCFIDPVNFQQSIEKFKPVFLLSGERGSGKRFLMHSLAQQLGLHCYQFECSYFQSSSLEQIHTDLKTLFNNLRVSTPCFLLMNDFEQYAKNTDNTTEYRLVDAFEKELEKIFKKNYLNYPLIVFCLVGDKKSLVSDLQRLFLATFSMPRFDAGTRRHVLRWLVRERCLDVAATDALDEIADRAYGFNFGDLQNLLTKSKTSGDSVLAAGDLNRALDTIQKQYNESIGAPKVPKVYWDDIGGLERIKEEILRTINIPMRCKGFFRKGAFKRSGILLYGPPGTGKTLIAKAVATENNFCFLSVKGPELLNMYVGQSEKNIREKSLELVRRYQFKFLKNKKKTLVFTKARQASPCIIFFDELDSLIPKRGNLGDSSGVMDRLSSQMLTEMDQLNDDRFIFVIGATNRLDLIDTAFLRPGRFDKVLYVGVCDDTESKVKILTALLKRFKMELNARDLVSIADRCPKKVSGADLYSICSNAWMSAVRRIIQTHDQTADIVVTVADFEDALLVFNNK